NDVTPTIKVVVNQPGTIGVDFKSDGTVVATIFAPTAGTYSLTAPPLGDGSYRAGVSFTAVTGALGQASVPYTIDTLGPHITAMTPSGTIANAVSQATVTFSKAVNP